MHVRHEAPHPDLFRQSQVDDQLGHGVTFGAGSGNLEVDIRVVAQNQGRRPHEVLWGLLGSQPRGHRHGQAVVVRAPRFGGNGHPVGNCADPLGCDPVHLTKRVSGLL